MIGKTAFLACTAMALLVACTKDKQAVIEEKCYGEAPLTYDSLTKVIFDTKCATTNACHIPGGDGEGDFDTYTGVIVKKDLIVGRITNAGNPMPPAGSTPLSECEKQTLTDWVNDGAKEK